MNGCKLAVCPCDSTVLASALKDGQLATCTYGGTNGAAYVGRVVQRTVCCGESRLISVGKNSSSTWNNVRSADSAGMKFRALKAGECITVC